MKTRGLSFFGVMLLNACGATELHEVRLLPSQGVSSNVAVFVRGQEVPGPFVAVALLQATGHGSDGKVELLVDLLRKRAGKLGCDALIDLHFTEGATLVDAHGTCVRLETGVLPGGGK